METFWTLENSEVLLGRGAPLLAQGDYLNDCLIPEFSPDTLGDGEVADIPVAIGDLIVISQTCDLENRKLDFVAFSEFTD